VSGYEWLGAYQRAEAEQNIARLQQRVMNAENAMFVRMQELSAGKALDAEAQTELQAIRCALNVLLRIKTDRLKWPGLESGESPGTDPH
jgi:hypothetical protein